MNQRTIRAAPKQPRRKSVKEAAHKLSPRLVRPSPPTESDKFVVCQIQSDRASDQQPVEPKRFFGEWQCPDQTINDIEFPAVAPDIAGRPIRKDRLPPG